MATIENLKDKNNNIIYPITKMNAVFDDNNVDAGSHILNLQNQINANNMCPSSNVVTYSTTPQSSTVLFQAPSNGVAYLRYSISGTGYMGFHLQSSSGSDKAYNTQYFNVSGMYNATFVMKAGQRIYCYEVGSGLTINWGTTTFVKSEGQS